MCFSFQGSNAVTGALINGLEVRVGQIEQKLSDLDARGSEEHDNLTNERELHRFIMTGIQIAVPVDLKLNKGVISCVLIQM